MNNMNLLERINEQLQILNEADDKTLNLSDLQSTSWNDAYNAAKNQKELGDKNELYVIRLTSNTKGVDGSSRSLASAQAEEGRGDNVRYLLINLGVEKVTTIDSKWIKNNINSANFSTTTDPNKATFLALDETAKKDLGKELNRRGAKAKNRLNYDTAEAIRASTLNLDVPDTSVMNGNKKLTQPDVVKAYLAALIKKINETDAGKDIYDFYKATTDASSVSAANAFYDAMGQDTWKRVCNTKSPLFGNPTLTFGTYLYIKGGYTSSDLFVRAARVLSKIDNPEAGLNCKGSTFLLAINKSLLEFETENYANVIQLGDNILHHGGGNNIKNKRISSMGTKPLYVKGLLAVTIFTKENFGNDEDYDKVEKYFMGDENTPAIEEGNAATTWSPDQLSSMTVSPYETIKSRTEVFYKKDTGDLIPYYISVSTSLKGSSWVELDWKNDHEVVSYNEVKQAIEPYLGGTKEIYIKVGRDKSATPCKITQVMGLESVKTELVPFGKDGMAIKFNGSSLTSKDIADEIIYDVKDNILYLGSDAKPEEAKPEDTPEDSIEETSGESADPVEVAETGSGAVEEVPPEAVSTATDLVQKGLLDEIVPDGVDDGEMIRGCTVSRGDIIVGHDGNYYTVLKRNIGNGKWDVKSGTKILRWKPEVVKKIQEMGFSLNPGSWGSTGVTAAESFMTDLGYVRNDLYD